MSGSQRSVRMGTLWLCDPVGTGTWLSCARGGEGSGERRGGGEREM